MGHFPSAEDLQEFEARYCARCVHGTIPAGGCPVWAVHLIFNYHDEARPLLDVFIPYDERGNAACRMFLLAGRSHES